MNAYGSSIDVPTVNNAVGLIGFCQNQQAKQGETDRKIGDDDKKAGRWKGKVLRIVDSRRSFTPAVVANFPLAPRLRPRMYYFRNRY